MQRLGCHFSSQRDSSGLGAFFIVELERLYIQNEIYIINDNFLVEYCFSVFFYTKRDVLFSSVMRNITTQVSNIERFRVCIRLCLFFFVFFFFFFCGKELKK